MIARRAALASVLLGLGGGLAGCAPTETELLTEDFVARDNFPPGPQVYCYRTLAEVDCHRTPQAADIGRLVGSDPPLY